MESQSNDASVELADHDDDSPLPQRSRSEVVRDLFVFQLKLFVDGLRDVVLSPISLVLGIVGVLVSREPGEPFYRLLRAGRASERWIDLFGAAYDSQPRAADPTARAQQIQKEFERHMRGLEASLKDADYDQAARTNVERLRALWKKHTRSADTGTADDAAPDTDTAENRRES